MNKILSAASTLAAASLLALGICTPAQAQGGYAPLTISNVSQTNQLVSGGTFEGHSCTRFDGDPDWTCISLNDYGWFRDGLPGLGTTADSFGSEIVMEGSFSPPVNQCVGLKPMSIATGYIGSTDPLLICKGPGGWLPGNSSGTNLTIRFSDGSTVSSANAQQSGWQYSTDINGDATQWNHVNITSLAAMLQQFTNASAKAQPKGPVNAASTNAGVKPKK